MVSPIRKKHLGQHFLTNPETARRIAGFLKETADTIVEIGPGAGILTEVLIGRTGRLILIEKDAALLPDLKGRFGSRVDILHGDVLTLLPDLLDELGTATVVSNLPYNISSPVTFLLCQAAHLVPEMVLMYQKEVADRIRIEPGPLWLASSVFYDVKERMKLKPGSFSPPPKVHSSVLHFERLAQFEVEPDEGFFRFCRAIYENRRKLLARNLKRYGPHTVSVLDNLGLDHRIRVDQLDWTQLTLLYKEFCRYGIHI